MTCSKAKSTAPDSSDTGQSQEKLEEPISTSSNVCAQEQTCFIKISPPETSLDVPNNTPTFTFKPKAAISDAVSHIHQNMLNTTIPNIIITNLPTKHPDLHKNPIEHCHIHQVATSSPVTLAITVITPPPYPSMPILSAAILSYKKVTDLAKSIITTSAAHILSCNKSALAEEKDKKG
ncbi:hypothetical protein C8R48DRAFT_679892 [Suillus tomentosus]|nr:hypothetical protein C8R48DRAFT_679892 [Suillus tomentosus]